MLIIPVQYAPVAWRPSRHWVSKALRRGGPCGVAYMSMCRSYAWQPTHDGRAITVSIDDAHLLENHLWSVNQKGYVSRLDRGNGKRLLLHRVIMQVTDPNVPVDHIDGDTLNNQRSNIRIATPSGNQCNQKIRSDNSSGYRGVSKYRHRDGWIATIQVMGKQHRLGVFDTAHEAALAYNAAAKRLHGRFARLNKIDTVKKESG